MGLQFYIGNAGTGKSFGLYQKVLKEAEKHPKNQYLVLVPEQFTMQTQKDFVSMSPSGGILNIDILSFQRLAYRIFEETGSGKLPVLDEIGKIFVVRRAAEEKKDEFILMSKSMSKIGYINEVKSMISEFIQYEVRSETLERLMEGNRDRQQLYGKLHDMKLIYNGFLEYLKEKYITSEELLDVLYRVADRSDLLKGCTIVMDGFTGFTPIQKKMIYKLMQLCKNMWVTVTYDTKIPLKGTLPDYHLFYMSANMMRDFKRMAKEAGLENEEAVVLPADQNRRFQDSEALAALEAHLFRNSPGRYEKETNQIQIHMCRNPLQEMEYAAAEICRLVQKEGMRYGDIAIVTGDLNQYGDYAQRVLDRYGIPFFSDYKRNALANPAIACIRGLVECAVTNFSYESTVRLLKTGMLPINTEQTDQIQNYILAKGIRGQKRWSEPWQTPLNGMDEETHRQINGWKDLLIQPILPFAKVIRSKKSTVREKTVELYKLLEHFELEEKLQQYEQYFQEEGQNALAKEYEQIYSLVIQMLERLVDVIGDERADGQQYMKYLEAGFAELKVGIIPPGADQVTIGDIERSRLKEIKVLFFMGVNDGVIPKSKDHAGILSQLERGQLKEQGMELAPGRGEQYDTQRFYLYLNMTKPGRYLYLTYSKVDAQGGAMNPSYLIRTVKKLFPAVHVQDEEDRIKTIYDIGSATEGYEFILEHMKKEKPEGFYPLYRWYETQETYKSRLMRLRDAANDTGRQDPIQAALAKALYSDDLSGSVTRLEKYAACAYAHFLQYGIRAKEREEYGFYGVDFGNVLHAVLELYAKELKERGLDWTKVPESLQEELAEQCVDRAVMQYDATVLYYTARDRYRLIRMKRIAKRTIWAMTKQLQQGSFVPSQYEVQFQNTMAIQNGLGEAARLHIRGRIDRVDVFEDEERMYMKVVDYKTGKNKFRLFHVYCGTQLQLVTYMQAALSGAKRKTKGKKETVAAGIVYYRVDDPLLENEEKDKEKQGEHLLKALCVDGILNESDAVLHALDKNLADAGQAAEPYESSVVPVKLNKGGVLAKASRTVREEEFSVVMQYAEQKMKQMGEEILAGQIAVNPIDDEDQNICGFCAYKSVCIQQQKGGKLCGRTLEKIGESEVYARMKMELESLDGQKEEQ